MIELEQLRLSVLQLSYRHDKSAADNIATADLLMEYVKGSDKQPEPIVGEQNTDKADKAPKRRKAAS